MTQNIESIEYELTRRRVKHLRIQVVPPDGKVKVISPYGLDDKSINEFIIKRSSWIRKHQKRFKARQLKEELFFRAGETHYLWGQEYTLAIQETKLKAGAQLLDDVIELHIRPDTDFSGRLKLIDQFYRNQLNSIIPDLIVQWEAIIQVKASSFYVRKMKTRWGSCNVVSKRIAFNLELAKKPIQCLEYVVVHELVHLLEPSHNARFKGFMDRFLPDWRDRKKLLNSW